MHALGVVLLLGLVEVGLSFDNAVVNAAVLRRMPPFWRRMFLTVGVVIAVVGMRLAFPPLVVCVSAPLSPADARRVGLLAFLYLELLDASFSFDGVIGALAITADPVLIMAGLGIGAIAVRTLTVHLVREGTLAQYAYLEHGAHYAIGALGLLLIV